MIPGGRVFLQQLRLEELIDKYFNITHAVNFFPELLHAARLTVEFSILGEFFGILIGLTLALMRLSRLRAIRAPAVLYVDIFRGTPLLVQLMFIYFGLPYVGITLSPFMSGVIGLSLNSGAYVAEIFRAGIQSIHRGQMEAARSLGMTATQAMLYVILPQAFRRVIPPLTNEFVALIKDSSLLSVLTVMEMAYASRLYASATYNITPYTLAAAMYLLMTIPLAKLADRLERRLGVGSR